MRRARIIADIFLFISIFWLPWWSAMALGLAGLLFFIEYYEIIIAGFLIDGLYGAPIARFYHFQFVATILGLVLFLVCSRLKRRLRFYV